MINRDTYRVRSSEMRMWLVFPTWVIIRLCPLPKSHHWHDRKFTLQDWANGATRFTDMCSLIFWIHGVLFGILIRWGLW